MSARHTRDTRNARHTRHTRHIVSAFLVLCSLLLLAPRPAAAAGSLLLKTSPTAEPVEALTVSTNIRAQVTGNVARVYVTQEFSNPTSDWVEGLYVFPLDTDAAVDELLMHVGERTIRGEIRKKEQARALYEQARTEGRHASLVDQERPNLFTTSVANIAPQSSVKVEIAYLETIPYRDKRYSLRIPLAITPRYTPGAALDPSAPMASDEARSANATLGTSATPERVTSPQQQVNLQVELAPGFPLQSVNSLHHSVIVREDSLGRRITLDGTQVPADRDFELVWVPAAAPDVQAAAFAEQVDGETYALLMLSPPEMMSRTKEPRELIFIIDTSGSMFGPSIEQARAALQLGVDRLADGDRFNIIRFSSDATRLFEAPQPVSDASRSLASRFIASLQADGGTEMKPALEMAFATPPPPGMLRQIVFITDGCVSNESELITLIRDRIGVARLFTVGIGAAPNGYFLREAAAAGRGSSTLIAQREQVGERMQDLFIKLEQPALVGLALQWPGGAAADFAAQMPSDLYAGDPLVVLARVPQMPQGLLTLSGRSATHAWVRQLPVTFVGEQAGIAKLWARERIGELSRRGSLHGDTAGQSPTDVEASIVEVALKHHLVSEYTSLVAVDTTPVRPADATGHSEQAPTSAPVGSYWAASGTTGFARTATPAPLLAMIGVAALAFAALFYRAWLLVRVRGT
jgi:Ca-activated chloride channel family protein